MMKQDKIKVPLELAEEKDPLAWEEVSTEHIIHAGEYLVSDEAVDLSGNIFPVFSYE